MWSTWLALTRGDAVSQHESCVSDCLQPFTGSIEPTTGWPFPLTTLLEQSFRGLLLIIYFWVSITVFGKMQANVDFWFAGIFIKWFVLLPIIVKSWGSRFTRFMFAVKNVFDVILLNYFISWVRFKCENWGKPKYNSKTLNGNAQALRNLLNMANRFWHSHEVVSLLDPK